ncbi:putative HTH-type transcriptional regulator YtdP [Bacillus sp. J14TS2]|uniref:helix-turn-helix domain-containing protein n=1 Tax=Bacillus sp. J14TS2 TaxID=2807188 RepID=UPI001B2EBE7B|nr:helix-turn-helix domain-containing protein [Bacillus sp. J14TS2]GIN71223.1 putative HTH-type transcriptional regulator YtdP [Bacillus sp. J14TS2]
MKKQYNRKSVFVTLLVSFLLVLLFPILVQSLFYKKMETNLKDNTNQSNLALLKQASDVLDHELQQVTSLSAQISFHPKLSYILRQHADEDEYKISDYYSFMKDMQRYPLSNTFIYDYFLYIPERDILLSPTIKTNSSTFFNNIYNDQQLDYTEWKNRITQVKNSPKYFPVNTLLEGVSSSPIKMISYVQPLPPGQVKEPKAYLSIMINEQKIQNVLQTLEWANQGSIFILDEHNNVMTTTAKNNKKLTQLNLNFDKSEGTLQYQYNNQDMMVAYIVSNETNWKYVSIIPKNIVMKEVNTVKTLAVILLLICLVGGFVACYSLARHHYIPVRNLVESIIKNVNRKDEVKINEYHLIQESLNFSWDTEKRLRDSLATQTPKVRENFFVRLLNGFVDSATVNQESLDFMEISFLSDEFLVMLVDIEESYSMDDKITEKDWAITRFMISNIGHELVNENHHAFIVELGQKRLAIILNIIKRDQIYSLSTVTQHLKTILKDQFGIVISVGIGTSYPGLNQVVNSYREAVQALNYRMIKGNNRIISFNETNENAQDYYYPAEIELQLMNCIKIADYGQVERILDNVFKENFLNRRISMSMGKCLFFNMMSTHVKILNDMKINHRNVFSEEQDPVQELLACETVEEIHQKIKMIYKKLCEEMKEKRSDHSESLLRMIIDYIHHHYKDPMISLTTIAEEMNITPQYLSSFFKKQQGENLTEFIAKIRIKAAKKYLEETALTISQIAKQIGYANDIGLIRIFKKQEGITPGKYRANLKKAQNENEE